MVRTKERSRKEGRSEGEKSVIRETAANVWRLQTLGCVSMTTSGPGASCTVSS